MMKLIRTQAAGFQDRKGFSGAAPETTCRFRRLVRRNLGAQSKFQPVLFLKILLDSFKIRPQFIKNTTCNAGELRPDILVQIGNRRIGLVAGNLQFPAFQRFIFTPIRSSDISNSSKCHSTMTGASWEGKVWLRVRVNGGTR